MSLVIGSHFEFEACHNLPGEEVYGICSNMHGHRYELDIEVEGTVDQYGWICNFKELKEIVRENVIDVYDHSNLNDFFHVPTAENIAIFIFDKINGILQGKNYRLKKVKLHETSRNYAEVTASNIVI